MKQTTVAAFIAIGIAFIVLISGSFFIVTQTENALVLQFGKMVRVIETPGLKMKIPFVQDVKFFDRQLLTYNLPVIEVNAGDQKRMVVDMYVRYRITNVLMFFKNVGNKESVQNRLGKIMPDIMQEVIGRVPLSEMLSENRVRIMNEIQQKAQASAKDFGISVKDVRIIRADLPLENTEAILKRMESERRQEAMLFRAEGDEQAQGIRAKAEKDRTVLLANARKEAEILRGRGVAEGNRKYVEASNQDIDFFEYYRSMKAYPEALRPQDTTLIVSTNSPFFRFMTPQEK